MFIVNRPTVLMAQLQLHKVSVLVSLPASGRHRTLNAGVILITVVSFLKYFKVTLLPYKVGHYIFFCQFFKKKLLGLTVDLPG